VPEVFGVKGHAALAHHTSNSAGHDHPNQTVVNFQYLYQVAEIACSVTKKYAQVVDFSLARSKF
jgi:hypothetical protein